MPTPAVSPVRLTEWTTCGGCAAKWGAAPLRALVAGLGDGAAADPLLIGLAPSDDAAVYRLTDDLALVSTTDFFPPLVDDPHDFGAVAAANACSDVFAMGGEVRLALNLAAFPEELPTDAIAAILDGASETVRAAGGVVAGGHTIRNPEPIFGLAVQGLVHPQRVWTKGRARAGDALVLSKPLGTGIALAGGEPVAVGAAVVSMRTLNRAAAAQLAAIDGGAGPHACTDVTGYGLLGHAWEVADRSALALHLEAGALPLLPGAHAAAARGVRTGGDARNREAHQDHVDVGPHLDPAVEALAHDPQTSGGLLAAVPPRDAERLRDQGWAVIGEVRHGPAHLTLA
ncbi:MAG TPA: selenide, water dikinase SelD [Acidimicrobiales bacterium]|nr:selenide, water dikinase SelD [Acidimicrobiales bacterium]